MRRRKHLDVTCRRSVSFLKRSARPKSSLDLDDFTMWCACMRALLLCDDLQVCAQPRISASFCHAGSKEWLESANSADPDVALYITKTRAHHSLPYLCRTKIWTRDLEPSKNPAKYVTKYATNKGCPAIHQAGAATAVLRSAGDRLRCAV